jgi:hypothetical protein
VIYTFRLHGQGFLPESIVLAGSTTMYDPMEEVVPSRYISPTEIEVTIDTARYAEALIHLSVLQSQMGMRSSTVTINPNLRPGIPRAAINGGTFEVHSSNISLGVGPITGFAIADNFIAHSAESVILNSGPTITSHSPDPVNARPQALYVTYSGSGFVSGCTFQLTGPSGPQSGPCTNVQPTSARANFNPTTPGSHQIVIINPSPGGAGSYVFTIHPTVATQTSAGDEPPS